MNISTRNEINIISIFFSILLFIIGGYVIYHALKIPDNKDSLIIIIFALFIFFIGSYNLFNCKRRIESHSVDKITTNKAEKIIAIGKKRFIKKHISFFVGLYLLFFIAIPFFFYRFDLFEGVKYSLLVGIILFPFYIYSVVKYGNYLWNSYNNVAEYNDSKNQIE